MSLPLLTRSPAQWQALSGLHTAAEIVQQPRIWRELAASLAAQQGEIGRCLQHWLHAADSLVIFTGAGSSAFIGEVLADEVNHQWPCEVRAIATTSLLSHPRLYLRRERPTLLVSFARSGNSPESLAAVQLLREQVSGCGFLNITCNEQGALYREGREQADTLNLLMPVGSCDQGFAMTSSFSAMLLAALTVFASEPWPQREQRLLALAEQGEQVLQATAERLAGLALAERPRVVFLGDGPMAAIAKESALKLLELTAGRVVAFADSSLGFRHGPKSLLNADTLVLLYASSDAHARRYQQDLLDELRRDGVAGEVLALGPALPPFGEPDIGLPAQAGGDAWQGLLGLLLAQQYALQRAVALGGTPDNPFPGGTVNRVVQGVSIYPFKSA
ncbi:tagatose-6-phosphate ketose/aldose isomerase [Paucibacter oligotrophus]|uniref:Tagatose-6-phosphate ketose/aldose isomerase n=1 Tax=Roseateles oligotrophus TaxID=1769250 RepID=A0A840L9N0_9BURK|nr:SIS domain-containing protein [Roseateles oligotrophus]MBB4844461.1 tagatose-6-phosphate ketose/aldose isomerase [Roseateles oligotrophus]